MTELASRSRSIWIWASPEYQPCAGMSTQRCSASLHPDLVVRIDLNVLCVDTIFRTPADHELVTTCRHLRLVVAIYIESIPFPGGPELKPAPHRNLC